jgi:thiamine biosynthesis lipoprotein
MGTTVSITVVGDAPDTARQAISDARGELQRIGREWYPWAHDGELVRLNTALANGQTGSASPQLAQLLQRSQEYFHLSEGAFDPAVGGLVRLWGFDSADTDSRRLPTEKQLSAWVKSHPTLADIHIENGAVRSERRDVVLDLGAIGKGYAVDSAIELLQQRGIHNALVNAGGNLRALGHAPGNNNTQPWRIAIRDPRAVRALAWLELSGDESVSTSGDYERFIFVAGKRIHHLLDPFTGRSADHTIAVTVVGNDGTLVDAASTAIFVAGPNRWQSVAHAFKVDLIMRIDATGQVQVSRKLQSRLQRPSNETRETAWVTVDL